MGKEVSIFTNQTGVPAKLNKRVTALGQKLASSGLTTRRIQTNTNGTFKRIVNGEQIGKAVRSEINVIIVNALPNVSRIFYRDKYDPNKEPTLPNCWSNLGNKPEPNVPEPQHTNCADCPMNIKGSGENGGRACRYQRRIAVMVEGDPKHEVYQFNIPAKSLFGKGKGNVHPFESYVRYLLANDESPDTVVTNIKYDDDADQMELMFTPVRSVTEEEYDAVIEAQSSPEAELYTKITAAQMDGVGKKPAPTTQKVERSEEPDEDEDEEEDNTLSEPDEPEEPKKRKSKKQAEAEAQADDDLSLAIEEWGAEDA